MVHLKGFGLIGCASAWALAERSVPFTWSDTDSAHTAWRACTGAIYPSASGRDADGYAAWTRVAKGRPTWWQLTQHASLLEAADYWYCTKAAPHGVKGFPVKQVGPLKQHPVGSFHFNAQAFVTLTRERFQSSRVEIPAQQDMTVVSHGFNDRLRRYVWGWTQLVKLDTTALGTGTRRPSVYLRRGRVVMAYAYPVAGTPYWYAGSTLLVQRTAQEREPGADVDRWNRRWEALTEGLLPVVDRVWPVVQGWRPSTGSVEKEPSQALWERRADGTLVVMPCWHSGVRWLPLIVEGLLSELGLR